MKILATLLVLGILWIAWELYRAPIVPNEEEPHAMGKNK
jgi:hypothetical protein